MAATSPPNPPPTTVISFLAFMPTRRPACALGFREPSADSATPRNVNERRRAELDGAHSELSAAEGGTISGRRPMEELVRRAQRGDTRAMNELLTEIAPYVGRIC